MSHHRKLIEVSLPLEAINQASVYEKFIRMGHPNVLHQWWSRKPLAAARGVIFASLVDDPSEYLSDEAAIQQERQRLFAVLEQLVQWENSYNEAVLDKARLEIARSVARNLNFELPVGRAAVLKFLGEYAPPVLDPFAGGGSIPLEALRLGLRSYASDLNPVAVLINKAMIEIPPRFVDRAPIHPVKETNQLHLKSSREGIEGLIEDLHYYGNWIQAEAEKRIGWLYSPIRLPEKVGGGLATVVAWLWVRTTRCPNPACQAEMPLASKWLLSEKKGREIWVKPVVDRSIIPPQVRFTIESGKGKLPDRTVDRRGAVCIACKTPVVLEYIRSEAMAGRMGVQMIAIATDTGKGRYYLEPTQEQIDLSNKAKPGWRPDQPINGVMVSNVTAYGYEVFADLFTPRQLTALNTLADLILEIHEIARADAVHSGLKDDGINLSKGGDQAEAYADAIVTYLSFAFSKTLNRSNAFVPWGVAVECPVNLFSRQTIAFIWDFAESNVISGPSGSFSSMLEGMLKGLEKTAVSTPTIGLAFQSDAIETGNSLPPMVISTDPPYYDVIPYADLSDFFYVWLRRLLGGVYPELFSTVLTPKTQELIADANRAGSQEKAREQFEQGMFRVFSHLREVSHTDYPLTVYYAYKQQEAKGTDQQASTGWETILTGIIGSGFMITGTWPMRTERETKVASLESNVLASSIILACRRRPMEATVASRRDFLNILHNELSVRLAELKQGNIAPVDLAQAAIGPGMSVFSRYSQVLEADGTQMTVRTALALINQTLDEFLAEQEGSYDADTRWAIAWFDQYGFEIGPFGVAETLSKAKNTSVSGLVEAGILEARAGKVRLLRRHEMAGTSIQGKAVKEPSAFYNWYPSQDKRLTTWEAAQHLIQALDNGGEQIAAQLLSRLGAHAEPARDLAYRLYTICERKKWAQEAMACNMLVIAWPRLRDLARSKQDITQKTLF